MTSLTCLAAQLERLSLDELLELLVTPGNGMERSGDGERVSAVMVQARIEMGP